MKKVIKKVKKKGKPTYPTYQSVRPALKKKFPFSFDLSQRLLQ